MYLDGWEVAIKINGSYNEIHHIRAENNAVSDTAIYINSGLYNTIHDCQFGSAEEILYQGSDVYGTMFFNNYTAYGGTFTVPNDDSLFSFTYNCLKTEIHFGSHSTVAIGNNPTGYFDIHGRKLITDWFNLPANQATNPSAGDMFWKQGASAAVDTLFIYINSKWQKFVGIVNNP